MNCLSGSSRPVWERLLSRGSITAPTRGLLHLSSNRRSRRMFWQSWRSKPAFRRTSFSPGFRANCRRPSTSTRQTACFRVRTLKPLNHGGTRDGCHLDDHHRVYRGRYRQVHHAGKPNEPQGFILTAILGIVGAFVASFLGQMLGWYGPGEGAGLIGAVVGAIIVLFVYGYFAGRKTA